jgi:hypothetical protein
MVGLAAVFLVVGVFAIAQADGPRAYTFMWRVPLAVFVVVAGLWSVGRAAEAVLPARARLFAVVAIVAVVAWGSIDLAAAIPSARPSVDLDLREPTLRRLVAQVDEDGFPAGRSVLVRPAGPNLPNLFRGVVNELDRAGVDVRVDPTQGRIFGPERVAGPADVDATWYVVELGSYLEPLLATPGARVVARTDPLNAAEEAELTMLQSRLGRQLRRAGRSDLREHVDSPLIALIVAKVRGVDQDVAGRVAALNDEVARSGSCRCAIVEIRAPR